MKRPAVLVFGEIIWDVYPDRSCIGGAPLNFAAHFVRQGGRAGLLSAVGRDALGAPALNFLAENGVDTRFVGQTDYPTGRCDVTLSEAGIPSYYVVPDVAYDHIPADPSLPEAVREAGYDVLCFGTLAQRGESRAALELFLEKGSFRHIFCDVNLRPDCYDAGSVDNCLSYATLLKISDEEEPLLRQVAGYLPEGAPLEDAPDVLFASHPQLEAVILTQGAEGATLYRRDAAPLSIPAAPARVVSTVGAGDSFGAAWLYHYLSGDGPLACLEAAAKRAAFVVGHSEAVPGEPCAVQSPVS
ncbi:MAG: carbohydrate kinase [Clostridia bacterium]|nr:carbohydrate kinase [Clostridia bacterium]